MPLYPSQAKEKQDELVSLLCTRLDSLIPRYLKEDGVSLTWPTEDIPFSKALRDRVGEAYSSLGWEVKFHAGDRKELWKEDVIDLKTE